MTDEHKQRLADYKIEIAVWPDAYLGKDGKSEPTQKSTFAHLGGKSILPAPTPQPKGKKSITFDHLGGRHVEPDASEE